MDKKCPNCGKLFLNNGNLARHLKNNLCHNGAGNSLSYMSVCQNMRTTNMLKIVWRASLNWVLQHFLFVKNRLTTFDMTQISIYPSTGKLLKTEFLSVAYLRESYSMSDMFQKVVHYSRYGKSSNDQPSAMSQLWEMFSSQKKFDSSFKNL